MNPQLPAVQERDSWVEYRRLVLAALKDLKDELERVNSDIKKINDDVLVLKVKSGLWGAVGGVIASLAASYIFNLIVHGVK